MANSLWLKNFAASLSRGAVKRPARRADLRIEALEDRQLMSVSSLLVNHAPVAHPDHAAAAQGTSVNVNVLANDTDADHDTLTIKSVSQPAHGSVSVNQGKTSLTYTADASFSGNVSFPYTVSDGRGKTARGTVTVAVSAAVAAPTDSWPARVFAPYVDISLNPNYDLAGVTQNEGVHYFTLGFITADADGDASWGSYTDYKVTNNAFNTQLAGRINAVRSQGGDVMVSFGGADPHDTDDTAASHPELALVRSSASSLQNSYQAIINQYNLTHLDFDIEGSALLDRASIDRRSQAIFNLQQTAAQNHKELQVWFTLPTGHGGLSADGLYVLQSALQRGVKITGVNIMAMDYGDTAADDHMGQWATDAATALHGQLASLYGTQKTDAQLWGLIGVTPMIGMNDNTDEIFYADNATAVTTFAEQNGLGRISMWSLNRDRQSPQGALNHVDDSSSSLTQPAFLYAHIFNDFTTQPGSGQGNDSTPGTLPAGLPAAAQAFTHSDEHYGQFIRDAYTQYLGRTAGPGEIQLWLGALRAGSSDEQMEAGFIGAPEYVANHGGTGAGWITGMYQDLLGRTPNQTEVDLWTNAMSHGLTPTQVALGFAAGAEREALRVQANYQTYLGRQASAQEVDLWVKAFTAGQMTNEQMEAGFVSSLEYFNSPLKGNGTKADWVASVYLDVLHRTASQGEIDAWAASLS